MPEPVGQGRTCQEHPQVYLKSDPGHFFFSAGEYECTFCEERSPTPAQEKVYLAVRWRGAQRRASRPAPGLDVMRVIPGTLEELRGAAGEVCPRVPGLGVGCCDLGSSRRDALAITLQYFTLQDGDFIT